MSKQRVVLVTGGMGGLGETISTKMVDAGYKVAVTYSPGNTKHAEWVAADEARGYDILAVPCDVADFDSCAKAVAEVQREARAGRRAGQQRRHHARHDLQEDGQGQLGRGDAHQPRQPVQHDQAGRRRHGRARLGPHHQRLVGQRLEGRVRPDQLLGRQGRRARLHQGAGARGARRRASPSTPSRPATSARRWSRRSRRRCWTRKILPHIPVGRLGKPEEVAGLIIYLASEEAAFVTGANIAINGGQHMQ